MSPERLVDEELLLLREAARLLGKSLDPGVVIREMLHLLSELLGLNRGRVVLPDEGSRTLSIRHAYGLTSAEIARGRYAFGEGVTGKVMDSGEPHIVQDIDAESDYLGRAVARTTLPQETVSFIAVPIRDERGVCGVLAVQRLRGRKRAFADDMTVLRTVATLIGQLLQLQRLVAERTARLESENRALQQALETSRAQAGSRDIVGSSPAPAGRVYRRIESTDRPRLEQALLHAGGNKSRAAQMLGLTLRQFNYRFKVLGLRD
jgi:Nif-specific regulatory protein